MRAKALEVRDEGTFVALLAVDMNPGAEGGSLAERSLGRSRQLYLLRRVGYPCDGRPNIVITKLSADGDRACNDPHYWRDRTFATAHAYIIKHWEDLKDGDVVDVQFILGETKAPKVSERNSGAT